MSPSCGCRPVTRQHSPRRRCCCAVRTCSQPAEIGKRAGGGSSEGVCFVVARQTGRQTSYTKNKAAHLPKLLAGVGAVAAGDGPIGAALGHLVLPAGRGVGARGRGELGKRRPMHGMGGQPGWRPKTVQNQHPGAGSFVTMCGSRQAAEHWVADRRRGARDGLLPSASGKAQAGHCAPPTLLSK